MKVHTHLPLAIPIPNPVITLGTFDGVHLGHGKILSRVKERAAAIGGQSVVITFDPHPRQVLFPDDDTLRLLNTPAEKIANLQRNGIDNVVIIPFTKDFSRLTALGFVRDILVNQLCVAELVIGYDHHFGRNREGSIDNLREMAATFGFTVEEIPAQLVDEVTISSTKIRRALQEGDVAAANAYLGYDFELSGKVVHGQRLGHTIGFPTANISIADPYKIIPHTGVYAIHIRVKQNWYNGVMNIGYRPTVGDFNALRLEAHIFDFDGDIYDEEVTVSVVQKIRDEQKFASLDALKEQIAADAVSAKNILTSTPNA